MYEVNFVLKTIKDIDFKAIDREELLHTPPEVFNDMTLEQAADILQPQVDAYHEGGKWSPRPHFGKALELAVECLRKAAAEEKGDCNA